MTIRFWFGKQLNQWRMWGVTFKGPSRYWFVGISREKK